MESAILAGILTSISQGVLVAGPDRKIVFSNRAFLEITGFDRSDIIGKTCKLMQGPATDPTTVAAIGAAVDAGVEFSGEILNYRKSGEPFWNDLTISPQLNDDGTVRYFVGVTRDVTQRKLADLKIAKLEADYRFIFENVQCGVVLHKANTEIIYANSMAHDLFGIDNDDDTVIGAANGDPRWLLVQEDGALLPISEYPVNRAVAARKPIRDMIFGNKRVRDGKLVWLLCNAFPALDDEGSVVEVLTSFTDITLQRELDEKLRQSQKLEATGQLTGGVAHDFNNLLMVISGNAELLAECDLPPEAKDMVDQINQAAESGADLTRRLLSFARKQPLEPRALEIADHLNTVSQLTRRVLPESISVEVLCQRDLWLANADPGQLENSLINLAVNARDAMPDGGTLTIEAANLTLGQDYVRVDPNLKEGDYIQISVTDNGNGMAPDVLAQAFDPFFTTKPVGQGTGLGLSMVYGFAKQSNGHLSIYSEPGQGTTVRLYLPRAEGDAKPITTNRSSGALPQGGETILLVEDNDLVLAHVQRLLKSLGYNVIPASNGPEALDALSCEQTIDLLFTDMVLPGGMTGKNLADAALVMRPGLKVLFTSGYTKNAIIHDGRVDPDVSLLSKPYGRTELAETLRRLLD